MKCSRFLLLVTLLAASGCRSSGAPAAQKPVGYVPDSVRAEVASLISQLKSESEVVSYADEKAESIAIDRLCEIGLPAVGQLVASYYESTSDPQLRHFRYFVLDTLKRMQQPASLPFIMQVAQYGDRREKRVAVEAIWAFGDSMCVETLINALEDEDTEVVNTAAAGLRAITGVSFGLYPNATPRQREEAIRKWQHWWSVTGGSYQARQTGSQR